MALAAAGCNRDEQRRNSVEFHAEAIRQGIGMVRAAMPQHEEFSMKRAVGALNASLQGVDEKIKSQAPNKMEERIAAANKARALFDADIRSQLGSLKYDDAAMQAKLDELSKLIDQVEHQ